jgi:hypothetical protein
LLSMHFFPHLSGLSAPHSPLHCSALGMHAPSHSLKFLSFSGRHLSPHFFGFTEPHFPWHCSSLAMHWPSHSCSFSVANSRHDLLAITIIKGLGYQIELRSNSRHDLLAITIIKGLGYQIELSCFGKYF